MGTSIATLRAGQHCTGYPYIFPDMGSHYVLAKEHGYLNSKETTPDPWACCGAQRKNFLAKRGSEPVGWKKSGILMGAIYPKEINLIIKKILIVLRQLQPRE